MSDQEQAERGASTVSNRGYWISQASLDDIAEREVQLRTDLERVTAERDAMREVEQLARDIYGPHTYREWLTQMRAALARLDASALACRDATRKATADAAEEGK